MESQESKIRKGQAFNLAVADAIRNDQNNNPKYIYQRFAYYHELANVVQGSDVSMILEVVNNKDFDKVIKSISDVFNAGESK